MPEGVLHRAKGQSPGGGAAGRVGAHTMRRSAASAIVALSAPVPVQHSRSAGRASGREDWGCTPTVTAVWCTDILCRCLG